MPRFQFTIRGLLWATFWSAVALLPWGLAIQYGVQDKQPSEIMALAVIAGFYAPFVAVGALFGRAWLGLKVGVFTVGMGIILIVVLALVVKVLSL
ncbi:MAG: hypothetical protein K8T91_22500 [Planctomycetes bacterium]|nr:hypothetical protein [Planctomycetota bacterium]